MDEKQTKSHYRFGSGFAFLWSGFRRKFYSFVRFSPRGFAFKAVFAAGFYSWGPAFTRALPASLPVYLSKFLTKREARSFAFSSQTPASA